MKKQKLLSFGIIAVLAAFVIAGCSPVTLTSWKNPKENEQISKVVVWGMFKKLEYEKPFEDAMVQYFNTKGLKAIAALDLIDPTKKYEYTELERIVDSVGADAVVIFAYKGTDKEKDYVPPTTTMFPSYPPYYMNYYGYYNYNYPYYGPGYYGPGYNMVTTGGYWTTTTIVNLTANLYGNKKDEILWTASVSITNANYIDQAGTDIAKSIYQDWLKDNLLK
ncbi:MAG: hypothetical protein ISR57_03840 [Bacteroidales bacterium]|nr:hypothetical protein [Bacteroidota bacterium]MBL6949757.1 hypothetical protein [Bacteroidales bacterium]